MRNRKLSDTIVSEEEKNKILSEVLSTQTCDNSVTSKAIFYFALAVPAAFLFFILNIDSVNCWFSQYVCDPYYLLLTKTLIFFSFIYIWDRIIVNWRAISNICYN